MSGILLSTPDPSALPQTSPDVREAPFAGSTMGAIPATDPAQLTPEDKRILKAALQEAQNPVPADSRKVTALEDLKFKRQVDPLAEFMDPEHQDNLLSVTYYWTPKESCRYVFKDGKVAEFVNHIFPTMDVAQIAELDKEMQVLELKKATGLIEAEELTDPMQAMKNKIIREFLAKQAQRRAIANNPNNTPGDYTTKPGVSAANTRMAISADVAMSAMASAAAPESSGVAMFPAAPTGPSISTLQARVAAMRAAVPK